MNNDKCVLVEFANEDNSIAVGFQDWLLKDRNYEENLESIIKNKTLVEILWPSCEVKSAQQMKKVVKSLTKKDWIKSAVRILAFGEWTDMHRQLTEIEKFDICNPDKKERKRLMKKSVSNDEDNSTCTKKAKNDSKFYKRSKAVSQENIVKQIKEQKYSSYALSFTSSEDETIVSSNDDGCCTKSLAKKTKHEKRVKQIVEIDTRLDSLLQKVNKMENVTNRILEKQQIVFENVSSTVKSVFMEELEEQSLQANNEETNITLVRMSPIEDPLIHNMEDMNKNIIQTIPVDNIQRMPVNNSNQPEKNDKNNFKVTGTCGNGKVKQTVNTDENAVPLGRGISIPEAVMKKVRSTDIGKMTCDLMTHLFSIQEIACSSRTGKKSNKISEQGSIHKKSLTTNDKFLAIKDYVLHHFKNVTNAEALFNTAVSNKCKNVARNYSKEKAMDS